MKMKDAKDEKERQMRMNEIRKNSCLYGEWKAEMQTLNTKCLEVKSKNE